MTPSGIVRGVVVAGALLSTWSASPSQAEPRPFATAQPALAACELPDLRRMHPAVQEQLGAAYASLVELEPPAGRSDDLGADRRRRERGDAYGALGTLLLAGDYPEAAAWCLQHAQMLAPGAFRWRYYLAHALLRQGDLEGAAASFQQAQRLDPGDFATLVWLVQVYIELDRPAPAESILARARALHPNAQAVYYQGGRAALAAQEYASAVEQLETALEMNPAATVIHYPLALAYRGLGDLERARDHMRRGGSRTGAGYAAGAAVPMSDPLMAALTTALRSPQAHRDLGLQATARADWPEAVRQFRSAVEMAPDNPVLRLNLGTALIRTGEARAAFAALEEAVKIDPRLAAAHYLLGTLLERNGRDAEAIERFRSAVTYDETLAPAHFQLADALRRNGRFEASLLHYRQVGELDEAVFGEAMALVRLGRYREAGARLTAAMERHPEQPAFPHALARLLATAPGDDGLRDGRRALELVQALAEEYQTASVAETMAMALAELGRFAEAAEWQRFAMGIVIDAALPDIARGMADNLTRYLRNEPCRMPWRDDEPEHNPGPVVDPTLLDPPPF